eukprot:2027959-Amphidinium_carterae.1
MTCSHAYPTLKNVVRFALVRRALCDQPEGASTFLGTVLVGEYFCYSRIAHCDTVLARHTSAPFCGSSTSMA